MKRLLVVTFAIASLAPQLIAQQDMKATVKPAPNPANPVSNVLRQQLEGRSKNMIAAAEQMPAEKYAYHPTPEQITFGHLIMHIAGSNGNLCSALAGATAPPSDLKDTDSKEKLVKALKDSFDFCSTSLAKVDDSKLSDELTIFNRKITRARAMFSLSNDWADHYAEEAMYLRLNGMLPPTAQPKK